ncbi:MAG TPA: CheR family methyltransferase [Candidatus Obscuribacterales bacterium]
MSADESDTQFEILLEHLKRIRGFDFTGYKRASLRRRVNKRLQALGIAGYVEYVDYLETHSREFSDLFDTILINVTSFFRDREAWDFLAREIIPRILQANSGEIRVWSAGCASGQEAYTLAMVMCEAMGAEAFRARVKIYATDIDEDALSQARHATYTTADLEDVPQELREKYFITAEGHHTFRPDLRRSVIFGRHDLVQDAPISRLDLLVCRNTLMYMNAETQQRILNRLHFAMKEDGFLFLGKAEMLLTHANLFSPVELRYRIFTKSASGRVRDRLPAPGIPATENAVTAGDRQALLSQLSFTNGIEGQIIVDNAGHLVLANDQACRLFNLKQQDIGRPLKDMEVSYRPLDLRSLADQVLSDRRTIRLSSVVHKTNRATTHVLDVHVIPVFGTASAPIAVSIAFLDVTKFHELGESLKTSHQELETTNEELQSTNEELETTNEELQSTNEELETTNEELQSANEELETTNEELQSTHEELSATNEELRVLTQEKNSSKSFLESILASVPSAVVVLDRSWNVRVWNDTAADLWGPRAAEVFGRDFFRLDIALPTDELRKPLEDFVAQGGTYEVLPVDTVDRRGRRIKLQLRVTPLTRHPGQHIGIVLLMDRVVHVDR